jgi:sugar/nucleoside kinase (ribokinase family)
VNDILSLRESQGIKERPLFLWEPYPDICVPDNWEDCLNAMKMVDIISPNVHEAAAFLGRTIEEEQPFELFKGEVEQLAREYTAHQTGSNSAIVLRCGKHGCLISNAEMMRWLPAFHETGEKVIDPTGGGNAFCGGFCVGWLQSEGDLVTAGIYGNISASFVIEQFGLPILENVEGQETWNGDTVEGRRARYEVRLQET